MTNQRNIIAIAVIAAIIVLGVVMWYITSTRKALSPSTSAVQAPAADETKSLGEKIYEQAQNPIEEKLPEVNPVDNVNPLQGTYKNPFE